MKKKMIMKNNQKKKNKIKIMKIKKAIKKKNYMIKYKI